jgi:hypothetical protein
MEIKDLSLFNNILNNKKALKKFSENFCIPFLTKHSKVFFQFLLNENKIKYYQITDTTKERIKNIPTEKIDGSKLIDLRNKQSTGLVYFKNGLHYIYLIKNNGVYIMSSSQKSKKIVNDVEFYTSQILSGFLYFDFNSGSSSCFINNILDCLQNKDNLLINDKKEIDLLKKARHEQELLSNLKKDYVEKHQETLLCLQSFLFIHFAKIIDSTKISENKKISLTEKMKGIKSFIDVIKIDTFYDQTINVINPFAVNGHFRNQPMGKNRDETKLIYIDSFMKTGYNRLATKIKIENNLKTR